MATKLTDAKVRTEPPPTERSYQITYDSEVAGFGIRITTAGARSFIFNYRNRATGREGRITIGSWPAWNTTRAREQAKSLRRRVDVGEDPMAARQADRDAPTVADMAARYMEDHTGHKAASSRLEDQKLLKQLVIPMLGGKRVQAVRRADMAAFHRALKPIRANRALALCSAMFKEAIGWEWIETNPCVGVKRNKEHGRQRYLSGAELGRLMAELARRPEARSNFIRLLLLTGCRCGELDSATWDQFDLTQGVWSKPHAATKQRKDHRIPLSAPARQLLAEMHAASHGDARLFPALPQLRRFWDGVCEASGFGEIVTVDDGKPEWQSNLRLHDLRHSHASFLASSGLSLPVIGALLGHSSAQTTQRYTHLLDEPLRQAAERVGRIVSDAGKEGGATVEQLHRKGVA